MIFNRKGSILQIVLVIFLILTFSLMVTYASIVENSRGIKRIKDTNISRLVEVSLIGHYKQSVYNNSLTSDSIYAADYKINYTVNNLGSYYEINTNIQTKRGTYGFILDIDIQTINVVRFEYK